MKQLLLLLFSITMISCSSQKKALQETLQASYETWVAGVRGGGSGIHFYVDLKTPLSKEIELEKVIFRGYEVPFEKIDSLHFIARIKTEGNQQKFDGDVTSKSTSPKTQYKLHPEEALLLFVKSGKEIKIKIKKVTERPMLEYPSAKPKF
ncbi:hypothetical protein [Flavobacterium sp.]|jgi:hypothetical protein|uniref:hypothetical protein n=1 Tax=Flavobacterium sp. TaxID=239 RepID=UPI0037C11B4B